MACPEPRKHVAIRARHPRSLLGGCVEATGASETRTHAASHSGARWSLCPAHVSPAHICVRLSIVCAPAERSLCDARAHVERRIMQCVLEQFYIAARVFPKLKSQFGTSTGCRWECQTGARDVKQTSRIERVLVRKLGPKRGLGQS
jgi:hypothetical protein